MSKLLELFGKAITVDTAELIWHWLMTVRTQHEPAPPPWQHRLDEVLEHLGCNQTAAAEEPLRFYLFEYPECIFGRLAAAAVCLREDEPDGALDQLKSVYVRQPSNTMALYAMGYCLERLGRAPEALEFYQDCIKFKSHLQLPRQRMAAIYLQSGRLDKAVREYEMLTTEYPDSVDSHVLLGNLYLMQGDHERALDTFNMAILAHPDNFHEETPGFEKGESLEVYDADESIDRILTTMDQVGPMPDLYLQLADLYERSGRSESAQEHYESALKLQPNYLEAAIKLGMHFLRQQRFSAAADQFNRAAEINDEIVDAYAGLCVSQYYAGKRNEALQTLALASAIEQNSILLFSETATLYFQAAQDAHDGNVSATDRKIIFLGDVVRAFEVQTRKQASNADILYKYGILLMAADREDEAADSFRRALEVNPTHTRSRTKLALCLHDGEAVDKGIQVLLDVPPIDQQTLHLHYKTALLFCDQKQFLRAMKYLRSVLLDSDSTGTCANVELVLENLGLIDRTMNNWKKLSEAVENLFTCQ